MCKNTIKKQEIATYLTFSTKQRKILPRFYPRQDLLHLHCWHIRTFLHLWVSLGIIIRIWRYIILMIYFKTFTSFDWLSIYFKVFCNTRLRIYISMCFYNMTLIKPLDFQSRFETENLNFSHDIKTGIKGFRK